MKKNNTFKHLILFTFLAIVFALFSVAFIPAKSVAAADNFSVVVNDQIITSIYGDFVGSKIENQDDALEYLNNFKSDFQFDNANENLVYTKTVESLIGYTYQFIQYIDGIKVYGGQLNVGTNQYKRIKSIDGKYFINPSYNKTINISQEEGVSVAQGLYQESEVLFEEAVILPEFECVSYIYLVKTADESLKVFVDASSGQIVKEVGVNTLARTSIYNTTGYNASSQTIQVQIDQQQVSIPVTKYTSTGSGGYFYALADSTVAKIYMNNGNHRNDYTYVCYDSSKNTADPASDFDDEDALKAYSSLIKCYNFYKNVSSFGISINGIKNKNNERIDLIAIVHFDNNYENAGYVEPQYSNSKYGYFIFGDGKNGSTNSFVDGLDIVGHEYQHAITASVVALEYSKESGALSEAYSDIFGSVIEGKGIDNADFWKLGEDVVLTGVKYLRNMSNPSSTGCVSSYNQISSYTRNPSSDYGGVHYVCTLPTYATYLMYRKAPEFFTEYNILRLWYQALTHLTPTSGIDAWCAAMMSSADELGFSEDIKSVIEYAFAAVGVPGYSGTKTWNNNNLTTFQGAGSIASPYLINSAADLASLAYYVNHGERDNFGNEYASMRYKLNVDLNLGDVQWIAIGTSSHPFNGYFNGGSHTISGLNLDGSESDAYNGLFAFVGDGGFIYDLNIGSGSTTAKADCVGAIVGKMLGGISGCSSELSITGKKVGGLVGYMINSDGGQKVLNSFVKADLVGDKVGGLVCTFASDKNQDDNLYESAYVTSCYYQGTITAQIGGGLVAEGNAIYIVNNLIYATFDGTDTSSTFGGLIANLSYKNPVDLINVQNVYNHILTNRVYASFVNNTQSQAGLLICNINGNILNGQTLISGNIAKSVQGVDFVVTTGNNSVTYENNKQSQDALFEGDFDFDNEYYFKNQQWTTLAQSGAFDLVGTFKVTKNQMPTFKEMEFWLNGAGYSFAGGDGSASNPYKISTAEQLATLASYMTSEYYYALYASKHYILTNDIDLAGKVWAGIGCARYYFENDQIQYNSQYTKTFYFTGTFDGNGYTIKNMKTLGLYSVGNSSNDGHTYLLYEYMPGLFSYTGLSSASSELPTIKNLTLSNVEVSGNMAGSVVSRAYVGLNLQNVKVMGGSVTSSGIAGGLVGRIEGMNIPDLAVVTSTIKDCYALLDISATVAGGAVGYVTNATTTNSSVLKVINFLARNNIKVIGIEKEATYDESVSYATYLRPIGGSVVGVSLISQLNIINTINLGDIVSYTKGAYIGGFIGAVGAGDALGASSVNILIDSCKQVGEMTCVFNGQTNVGGTIIGGTHESLTTHISVVVNNKTYANVAASEVYYNNSTSITVDSDIKVSEDEKGQGDFAIYSDEYYTNPKYFNLDYAWSDTEISRLGFIVTFMLDDGTILKQQIVKDGEVVIPPETNPTKQSTVAYDFEFIGYSEDYTHITKDTIIYALFEATAREYSITYENDNGDVIAVLKLGFGTSVNQDIQFTQKKSNIFVQYTFLRFGERGQTVVGDATVRPVYKAQLTGTGVGLISTIIGVIIGIIYVLTLRKRSENN